MKIVFCSNMYSDIEEDIRRSKEANPASGHILQKNFLQGLLENGKDVHVINASRVRRFPLYPQVIFHRRPFYHDGDGSGIDVGFINLFGLNHFTKMINIYRELKKAVRSAKKEGPVLIFTWNSSIDMTIPILIMKKRDSNVMSCDIIGDLYGQYSAPNRDSNPLTRKMIRAIENRTDRLSQRFDSFVFLTPYMAQALKVADRPYTIVEGIYAGDTNAPPPPKDTGDIDGKMIFYAGSIHEDYGILHLVRAFRLIEDPSYSLYIAGGGNTAGTLKEYEKMDGRIHYLGELPPSEVKKYQQKATALISPRTSDGIYVRYSFPSKTMECLASGKPFIAHRLPCEPPEYSRYIQYPDNETDEALRDKIVEICGSPQEKRDEIGEAARLFILNEKNPRAMTKRVIEMWEKMDM